jgi:hypothetical protein
MSMAFDRFYFTESVAMPMAVGLSHTNMVSGRVSEIGEHGAESGSVLRGGE